MTRLKRVLPLLAMVAIIAWFAARNSRLLFEAAHTLRYARPWPLFGAFAFQCLYYGFATLTVRQCLRLVDFRQPFLQSLRATFLLIFVSRIVPGPAATGPAAMYVILGRRGLDRTRAAFVGPMFYAVDYAAFFFLLLMGVLLAVLKHEDVRAAAAALPILAVAIAIAVIGVRAWRSPERVRAFLTHWRDSINRTMAAVRLRFRLPEGGPARVAGELADMRVRLDRHPGIGWKLGAAGTAMLICDVITMALCFVAFGFTPSISVALLGFCLATVGAIVSFLPGGLGTFELAMIAGFVGLGAPRPVALTATLAYRVIATWLPALLGLTASGELAQQQNEG